MSESLRHNSAQWQEQQSQIPLSWSLDFVYKGKLHLSSPILFIFCRLVPYEEVLNL